MSIKVFRRLVARSAIAVMLFAQLAVAAYACPALTGTADGIPVFVADDMHTAMPGCDETDISNSNLCLQHCQSGVQSVQSTPQVSVPAIALVPMATIGLIAPASGPGITAVSVLLERQTSPPPLIRFGVLRI
jgi:hypothetical protein